MAQPEAKGGMPDTPKFWFAETQSGEGYSLGTILHHDPVSDNMQVRLHPSDKVRAGAVHATRPMHTPPPPPPPHNHTSPTPTTTGARRGTHLSGA